jgi:hypothetical protein
MTEHIDQRRFANIASPDKSVFGSVAFGTLFVIGAADEIFGGNNFHCAQDTESKSGETERERSEKKALETDRSEKIN